MIDRIKDDTNVALRAGDRKTAAALRLLFNALKNAQIDAGSELSDEAATKVIKKEIKKRIEARDLFANNERPEQAALEEFERSVYAQYVPEEMSAEAIDKLVEEAASDLGDDVKFASVMPQVMRLTKGQADGRLVAERVKEYLSK